MGNTTATTRKIQQELFEVIRDVRSGDMPLNEAKTICSAVDKIIRAKDIELTLHKETLLTHRVDSD